MYGWRGRIGLLVPASNTTMESELYKMLPEGISLHTGRVLLTEGNEQGLIKMNTFAAKAAEELATANVDLIIYGCTSGSFMKGEEFNAELTKQLSRASGVKVITTSTAVKTALTNLRMTKIGLITPYPENRNVWARSWLKSLGIEASLTVQLLPSDESETVTNAAICRLHPEIVYKDIRRHNLVTVNGLFLSCTNLRTIEVIETLKDGLGIPVVTSNQASMWAALREIGYTKPIKAYGKLFSEG